MKKHIELNIKQIIGEKHYSLLASGANISKNRYMKLYAVCEPLTAETTNWYYKVTVNGESKLETTSLRSAVEEYNKY